MIAPMKLFARIALGALISVQFAHAEMRMFANKEGQTVEAEPVALEGTTVVMKLKNRKIAKVPLTSLSEQDQLFMKGWWEKNKNKLSSMDVRLTLGRTTKQIDRNSSRSGGNQRGNNRNTSVLVKKMSKSETKYTGELKSFARKNVEDIEIEYTIYKRISTRDKDGSETEVEEIEGETSIRRLDAFATETFEIDPIECLDTSETGGGKPRISHRETILGMVVTLSADGEEFLKQSHPDGFLDKLEEEAKREEERDD